MIFPPRKPLVVAILAATALNIANEAVASSHREALHISKYPQVDGTDFYMFNSYEEGREDFVTILANYNPIQAAFGGPNYFLLDNAGLYEIHIDNDGDAVEDITFQFQMKNGVPETGVVNFQIGEGDDQKEIPSVLRNVDVIAIGQQNGLSFEEKYSVAVVNKDDDNDQPQPITAADDPNVDVFAKPFDNAGTKTFSVDNYTAFADSFVNDVLIPGCDQQARVFVGQRLEGFKVALGEIFDLVNFVPIDGDSAPGADDGEGFPGGITQDAARNQLAFNNVTTIALEVHKSCLVGDGNGVIGGWTAASLPTETILKSEPSLEEPENFQGPLQQVSRLGNPLVNELVIGLTDKDKFNASKPADDAQFADFVTHPVLPAIIDVLFRDAVNDTLNADIPNLAPVNVPREDLVAGFLTGFEGVNQLEQVTPSDMLRLNTEIPAVGREEQNPLGVLAGDVAGFPNGRRPGDDTVDIALRVVMGALCHDLPLGDDDAGDDEDADDENADDDNDDGNNKWAKAFLNGKRGKKGEDDKVDDDNDDDDDNDNDNDNDDDNDNDNGDDDENEDDGNLVNLGFCDPEDAPVGNQQLIDGAPVSALDFDNTFPYLIAPLPGSPIGAPLPTPKN